MTTTKVLTAIEERIAAQQTKLAQLKAQKARLEAAKKTQDAKEERAADTRRKVLLGAYLQQQMQNDEDTRMQVLQGMSKWLSRGDDRLLFQLPLAETE